MFARINLATAFILALAAAAGAQSPPDQAPSSQQLEVAEPAPAQVPTAPRPQAPPAEIGAPRWTANGGFEADSHDTGYGFAGPTYVRPFRPQMSWVAGANVNYLYYEFPSAAGGHTNVRSPGVNALGGVRFGVRNYFQLAAGPGFKRRRVEVVDPFDNVIRSSTRTKVGLHLVGVGSVDPTPHNNFYGQVAYGAEDDYIWSRAAFKEQLTNRSWSGRFTHDLGGEATVQGNDDLRSVQFGPFIELVHVPSSTAIGLRGGYKHTSYDFGPDRTGPWFAIGIWHRLR
ncbi:MAG: cellulose biosynthesis protein BcsS [Candidatus Rokuibacteriota bacterium]